jgi:hypothetical protein
LLRTPEQKKAITRRRLDETGHLRHVNQLTREQRGILFTECVKYRKGLMGHLSRLLKISTDDVREMVDARIANETQFAKIAPWTDEATKKHSANMWISYLVEGQQYHYKNIRRALLRKKNTKEFDEHTSVKQSPAKIEWEFTNPLTREESEVWGCLHEGLNEIEIVRRTGYTRERVKRIMQRIKIKAVVSEE